MWTFFPRRNLLFGSEVRERKHLSMPSRFSRSLSALLWLFVSVFVPKNAKYCVFKRLNLPKSSPAQILVMRFQVPSHSTVYYSTICLTFALPHNVVSHPTSSIPSITPHSLLSCDERSQQALRQRRTRGSRSCRTRRSWRRGRDYRRPCLLLKSRRRVY